MPQPGRHASMASGGARSASPTPPAASDQREENLAWVDGVLRCTDMERVYNSVHDQSV